MIMRAIIKVEISALAESSAIAPPFLKRSSIDSLISLNSNLTTLYPSLTRSCKAITSSSSHLCRGSCYFITKLCVNCNRIKVRKLSAISKFI
ncbi:uncharacterized protein ACN2A1_000179 isoform 2-T2 [Glossina fuscipes fuscipes]